MRADFFALTGRDPSVLVPADAPAPAGSFFQIRRPFPLDLRLDAPVHVPEGSAQATPAATADFI